MTEIEFLLCVGGLFYGVALVAINHRLKKLEDKGHRHDDPKADRPQGR